jgi:hypothetical protein
MSRGGWVRRRARGAATRRGGGGLGGRWKWTAVLTASPSLGTAWAWT